MFQKFIFYLKKRLFYIWLLLFSIASILISPEPSLHYAVLGVFIFYYLLYAYNERLFSFVVLFITITLSLYYPVSQYYGSLNSGIVAAFLETNAGESLEFMQKISFSQMLFPVFYMLSAVILIRLKKYNLRSPFDSKKRVMYILLFGVFCFSLLFVPTKFYLEKASEEEDDVKWTLSNSPINIISFYVNIYESIRDYYTEKAELESAAYVMPPWQVLMASPEYQNYVLIIGESARRDYLSTYGFQLPTTPFLDQTKGYINSGYISAAPATYHSLLKSLYFKKDKKIDYSYNIITLAKAAGIETNWLSNQGSIGKYDTIASRIGASADFFYFTKKGGFNTADEDDFKLLEKLSERLEANNSPSKVRLFVLHLMGSHQDFCQRITEEEKKLEFVNKKMSCYVNSILKTDKLISDTIELLKSRNESYSLIYFSDHGLNHIEKESKENFNLDYDSKFKSNYEVPFVKISSDDLVRKMVNTKRSAFNFMYGFSQWLNITTQELNKNYDFFSAEDDKEIKVFNFEKNISFSELEDDFISEVKEIQ
ncbi:phosphoethanolamine transferase [Pasteurella oralis]|uniref:Phosphoethanolamine transferase n=1 Tax=Pasteurella oralis TaxID=1071947 RepID=A0ABW4NTL2_9PAST